MPPLRIATYNIHRCIGSDGRCDPQRIAAVLRELDADIVALQEVDNTEGRAPEALQLDTLAALTGMTPVAGLRLIKHLGNYGNALLTNWPVLSVQRHDLSYSRFEPRGALDVLIDVHGTTMRVIATHLGLIPGERRHQVQKILELAMQTPKEQPVVLLGDINEWWPTGRILRWLHAKFGRPPAPRSFPARCPLFALDRVWLRPRQHLLTVNAHRSATARAASDHLPVVAQVDVG